MDAFTNILPNVKTGCISVKRADVNHMEFSRGFVFTIVIFTNTRVRTAWQHRDISVVSTDADFT